MKIIRAIEAGLLALAASYVLSPSPAFAKEPDYSNAIKASPGYDTLTARPMWIEKITDGLYVIRGPITISKDDKLPHEPGDTTVRVTPGGVILVDAKYPENAAGILQLVKSITDQPVKYLINTHYHRDHSGGDAFMAEHGVEIVNQTSLRDDYVRNYLQKGEPAPRVVFGDSGAINLGGVRVEMYHFCPAHTEGDTVVYFPGLKAVSMGDVVIDGMPHIDYRGGGGSALGFVSFIDDILKLDFTVARPGHGRLMSKDFVRNYVKYVEIMNDRMKDVVSGGVPKDVARIAAALKLDDLPTDSPGIYWNHSVSTSIFMHMDLFGYHDEMARALADRQNGEPSLVPGGFTSRYGKITDVPAP